MDGLKAFTYLCDHVPQWKERLDQLTHRVNERHLEFTRLARTASSGGDALCRRRTGSTESLRPQNETDDHPDSKPSTPVRVDINPETKRLFQEYRLQAKRKRASASLHSQGSATSIPGPRSRMSLIVYYDSAIQDSFEEMVRAIASARNTLRKGQRDASMKARMARMGMEESPFEGNRTDFSMRNPKIPRLTRTTSPGSGSGAYSSEPFEQIDKELETAQTLCEVGAHQFLRDGTCADLLAGTQERVDAVLVLATEQRAVYEAEAHAEAAAAAQRESCADRTPDGVDGASREGISALDTVPGDPIAVDTSYTGSHMLVADLDPLAGGIAVDPHVEAQSIAVDPGLAGGIIAVDPAVTAGELVEVDPLMAVDSIAIDPSAGRPPDKTGSAPMIEGIAVDPDFMSSLLATDPKVASNDLPEVDLGIAVDPDYSSEPKPAVDAQALMEGVLAVDPHMSLDTDSKSASYRYLAGPIEIDTDDNDELPINLANFRRTRAM